MGPETVHFQQASSLGQFIPLHYHYNMLLDEARINSFREAIEYVVRPGMRVLELGGGTGVLSYFAARQGARVWCVELNPDLVRAARHFLPLNDGGDRVRVVEADAGTFVPPEPVDVVICEMLHVGLLREQQAAVIESFKERYLQRFGGPLPRFLPEVTLLAMQPVEHSFRFGGYRAPIPLFQAAGGDYRDTLGLSGPQIYETIWYEKTLPERIEWQGLIEMTAAGELNALRFATRSILAFHLEERRGIEWSNQHLVLPIREPVAVKPGDFVRVQFSYAPGGTLDSLAGSISVEALPQTLPLRRAA